MNDGNTVDDLNTMLGGYIGRECSDPLRSGDGDGVDVAQIVLKPEDAASLAAAPLLLETGRTEDAVLVYKRFLGFADEPYAERPTDARFQIYGRLAAEYLAFCEP